MEKSLVDEKDKGDEASESTSENLWTENEDGTFTTSKECSKYGSDEDSETKVVGKEEELVEEEEEGVEKEVTEKAEEGVGKAEEVLDIGIPQGIILRDVKPSKKKSFNIVRVDSGSIINLSHLLNSLLLWVISCTTMLFHSLIKISKSV